MKLKNTLPFIGSAIIGVTLLFAFTSSTTLKSTPAPNEKKTCIVTVSFSPTSGDLANCSIDNCNGTQGPSSVLSGTSWVPTLGALGCTTVGITTGFPAIHPAGTLTISKNGTTVVTHSVTRNQNVMFDDILSATCGDTFTVSW